MDTAVYSLSDEQILAIELSLRETWQEMYVKDILCDAVLKTEDGGIFKVHKSVLALCSPFLGVLFTKIWTDPIPGISKKVMEEIINFGYTGALTLTIENVVDILIAADRFSIDGLLNDCCDFLLRNLSIYNCKKIKEFAKALYCFDLEDKAHRFLMNNFVEVSQQSKEFLEMSFDEITELLNSDRINVKSEEQVWEACLRWIDYQPEERRQYIDRIIRCVRLGLLDNQYFMSNVKTHKYVEKNDSCRQTVIDTLKFQWDLEIIYQKTEEMETPLFAMPRLPNSILFAIGGRNVFMPIDNIETYDTKADRWVQLNETDPAGPRAFHKLAVIESDIYVIGGNNGIEFFRSCRCFNAITKQWREIAPMHAKRGYVSVAVVDNLIYAIGGSDGDQKLNSVERYDYRNNQWTFVSPMTAQRSDACATTFDGIIFIAGGYNGFECLASCEYYDPRINQWTSLTPMFHRRSGVSVICYHGKIYALGGFDGVSRLKSVERLDPSTGVWSEMPDMSYSRSNFAVEIMDDMLFAIGGFTGARSTVRVECFDDAKNVWYEATDMNIRRSALAVCVVHELPNVNDYIYPNRRGLIEEKRQRMLRLRNIETTLLDPRQDFPPEIQGIEHVEDENMFLEDEGFADEGDEV